MSKIVLTENVEDWELGEGFEPTDTLLEIHVPKSPEIRDTRQDAALVYILHSTGAVSRAFFLTNGVQYGHYNKPWTIVPRKKGVHFTVEEVIELWETKNPVFRAKDDDSLRFRIATIVQTEKEGEYIASIIIDNDVITTDLYDFSRKYYYLENGEWLSLTKKGKESK